MNLHGRLVIKFRYNILRTGFLAIFFYIVLKIVGLSLRQMLVILSVRVLLFIFRFIIKDKDTFFTNAQRSKICYEILSRAHFTDDDEEDDRHNKKFGKSSNALYFYILYLSIR